MRLTLGGYNETDVASIANVSVNSVAIGNTIKWQKLPSKIWSI
jgi:hypothetical protein